MTIHIPVWVLRWAAGLITLGVVLLVWIVLGVVLRVVLGKGR